MGQKNYRPHKLEEKFVGQNKNCSNQLQGQYFALKKLSSDNIFKGDSKRAKSKET